METILCAVSVFVPGPGSAVLKSIHETERVVSRPTPSGTRPFSQDGRGAFFSRWLHSEDVMVPASARAYSKALHAILIMYFARLLESAPVWSQLEQV